MTVLLAERDAEEASLYSDKLVLLESGKVMATGPPAEVLKDPAILSTLGISPPQMSQVSASLRERIQGSNFNFLTVDDAEKSIVDAFSMKRRSGPE